MNHEQKILAAAIRDRAAFEAVAASLREGDLTESAGLVWSVLGDYYRRDPGCGRADAELLSAAVGRAVSSDKHKDQFRQLVTDLAGQDISPANVMADFVAVRKEAAADRLASALLSNQATDELLAEYERWHNADSLAADEEAPEVFRGMDLNHIMEKDNPDSLIQVWPKSLNDRLDGGLLRGHHMVIFARPEMGKTLFVVNAMAGFLKQGLTVLYIGNEEPLEMTAQRMISRMSKMDKGTCHMDPHEAMRLAREMGYDNWIAARMYPGSPAEIGALCEEYQPDILVIDQLRNIRMKEDNYVQKLEKAASAARNLGKRYDCLVLSVTQAGDSASGKPVLDMGDVDSSNTGIPAQADVMVGIGCSEDDKDNGRRVLSLPKNKRSGNHDFFPVRIDPTKSRIISV